MLPKYIWQSGRFRHQMTRVRIQSSIEFYWSVYLLLTRYKNWFQRPRYVCLFELKLVNIICHWPTPTPTLSLPRKILTWECIQVDFLLHKSCSKSFCGRKKWTVVIKNNLKVLRLKTSSRLKTLKNILLCFKFCWFFTSKFHF